jgi:predicted nuclease with TOPRIM domain
MGTVKRGLRGVKTMAGLSDRRRSRSAAGALLELSVLAREKERLGHELAAAERRRNDIQNRLAEIAEKEGRLKDFIKDPPQIQDIAPAKAASQREVTRGVKTKEICY